MNDRWAGELWRISAVLLVSYLVGRGIGHPLELTALGLVAIVFYHLFQVRRMLGWIDKGGGLAPPEAGGIWSGLYQRIHQLQKKNQDRQHQLTELLSQFQRSAEAFPDAAVALGPSFEIRWFNEAAGTLLNLRPAQDVGQPIRNLLRTPQFVEYVSAGAFRGSVEIKSPADDHTRLSIRIVPYGEHQYLLLAQDVTERHRLERVRKDFVANVSHELRTPLTVISGFVENLRHDESGCAKRWERALGLMGQQSARMQRIVEDLLLLASLEGTQGLTPRETVEVREMLQEIVEESEAVESANGVPRLSLSAEPVRILGNTHQLRSAFTNLVTNAIKYTPAEGSISIRWFTDARGGVLEVTDTGEGVAAEHLPRLTERFYRVDAGRSREKGGTGLGLAIVKHVLQNHGARLEIESEVGKGSCFRCIFPDSRLASAAPVSVLAEAGNISGT
jgi:two-component system phosphate regulon sensor histidine kinase PhoR